MTKCIFFLGLSDLLGFLHSSVVAAAIIAQLVEQHHQQHNDYLRILRNYTYYVAHAGGNCSACTDYFTRTYGSSVATRESIAVGHHVIVDRGSRIILEIGDSGHFLEFYRNQKRLRSSPPKQGGATWATFELRILTPSKRNSLWGGDTSKPYISVRSFSPATLGSTSWEARCCSFSCQAKGDPPPSRRRQGGLVDNTPCCSGSTS